MNEDILEIVDMLEYLLEDLPMKIKVELESVIGSLKSLDDDFDVNALMKIQDDLEVISNLSNLDDFTRNEIINIVATIETLYN